MTRHLVVVGESNPYGADPKFALYHLPRAASGNRLRVIMGLSDADYLALARVNLCVGGWDQVAAEAAARRIVSAGADVVVGLGRRVATAFGYRRGLLTAGEVPPGSVAPAFRFVSLPHPSGLSRAWNLPGARDQAVRLLREHAPWVEWGQWGKVLVGP